MKKKMDFGRIFKILNRNFETKFNKALGKIDLTHSQLDILMYLFFNKEKEIHQRTIEKQFKLSNPTVTGLLNRLEQKGFIKRTPSLKDARLKKITITQKTIDLAKEMKKHKNKMEKKIIKDIQKNDIEVAYNVLEKMISNINEEEF